MGVRKVRQILRVSGINVVHKVEKGRQIDMIMEVGSCWNAGSFSSKKKKRISEEFCGEVKEKFWICKYR
jgi:hypothetical protein